MESQVNKEPSVCRPDPLRTIHKLIKERYKDAKAVFWGGSVSRGNGTSASDLDLVIVHDNLPNAYREAFIYDHWPIDAFVHDLETLRYFFKEFDTKSGMPALNCIIIEGREVVNHNNMAPRAKALAQEFFQDGPVIWDKQRIDRERFITTDILEDIKFASSKEEQIAAAASLYEPLSQFYFKSKGQWCGSGKAAIRYLQTVDPLLAAEFADAFNDFFQISSVDKLEKLIIKILEPYGGLLWDGFRSDAPKEWRIKE